MGLFAIELYCFPMLRLFMKHGGDSFFFESFLVAGSDVACVLISVDTVAVFVREIFALVAGKLWYI